MSAGQEVVVDPLQAVKYGILKRTAGLIHQLEVGLVADRLVIRGRAPSYYLKQLAIHAALEEVGSRGDAPRGGIDVQITVKPATSACVEQ